MSNMISARTYQPTYPEICYLRSKTTTVRTSDIEIAQDIRHVPLSQRIKLRVVSISYATDLKLRKRYSPMSYRVTATCAIAEKLYASVSRIFSMSSGVSKMGVDVLLI